MMQTHNENDTEDLGFLETESFILEEVNLDHFDNWLLSLNLDDPELMLVYATELVKAKYQTALSIKLSGFSYQRGFKFPVFLAQCPNGKTYTQGSERLLMGISR